jgi:hypothetical protein
MPGYALVSLPSSSDPPEQAKSAARAGGCAHELLEGRAEAYSALLCSRPCTRDDCSKLWLPQELLMTLVASILTRRLRARARHKSP